MYLKIKISSKNYISLKNFQTFYIYVCKTNSINSKLFLRYFAQQQKNFNFTVLKSPHVNKVAQEQFKYNLFSKQIFVCSFQLLKTLILLKKIQAILFSDVKINIKFFYSKKKIKKIKMKTVNPDNFKLNLFKTNSSIDYQQQQIKLYLNLFDIYGEISLNKN